MLIGETSSSLALLFMLATAPLEQALALEQSGHDAAAIVLLEAAIRAEPRWAMGRVELGRLQLKRGASEEALHHLDTSRSLASENPRAHYLYALAADELGRRNECRRALEVALTLRDGYADAQVRLGSVLVAEGELNGAVKALRSYLDTHPDAGGARLQLADALERSADHAGAERELRALMQHPALRTLAGRRLAGLLEAQGRSLEAEKIRQAIDPPPRRLRELGRSSR